MLHRPQVQPLALRLSTSHHHNSSLHQPTSQSNCGSNESSQQSLPPPVIKKKSLGVRKSHNTSVTASGGGSGRYQLPIKPAAHSITTFFKKSNSGSTTPVPTSQDQSTPECSPPVQHAVTAAAQHQSTPFIADPLPPFDSRPLLSTTSTASNKSSLTNNNMWDSSPPIPIMTHSPLMHSIIDLSENSRPVPDEPLLLHTNNLPPPPSSLQPPNAPSRAGRKSLTRIQSTDSSSSQVRVTSPNMQSLVNEGDENEVENGSTTSSNENVIPFQLNLCSQSTQPDVDAAEEDAPPVLPFESASERQDDDDDIDMLASTPLMPPPPPVAFTSSHTSNSNSILLTHAPLPQRSLSCSSDIVIQASQEEDDCGGGGISALPQKDDASDFAPLSSQDINAHSNITTADPIASQDSIQMHGGIADSCKSTSDSSPVIIRSTKAFAQRIASPPGMTSFRAFNESLQAQAQAAPPVRTSAMNFTNQSMNLFAIGRVNNNTAASSSSSAAAASASEANSMPPPPPNKRRARTAASVWAPTSSPPIRQLSLTGSQQSSSGLPPAVPKTTHQTTLNQLFRSSSNNMSMSQQQQQQQQQAASSSQQQQQQQSDLPSFSQTFSQTQHYTSCTQSSNSLESCASNSMFCTPQDAPIRERTCLEMAEELHHARENQAYYGNAANATPTHHATLTPSMKHGGGSNAGGGSSSFVIAPPQKKARLHFAATPTSNGVRSAILHTPSSRDSALDVTSPQKPTSKWHALIENPFDVAARAAAAAASSTAMQTTTSSSSSTSTTRANKKRGIGHAAPLPGSAAASSRFYLDFVDPEQIGSGSFADVYVVRHRVDGMLYAVKKSRARVTGPNSESLLLREVQSLCFISHQPHKPASILGYNTSWFEDGHLYIQMEYCKGGSLAGVMKKFATMNNTSTSSSLLSSQQQPSRPFSSTTLTLIMLQLSQAVSFLHSHSLVHLDIKPDNIFEVLPGLDYRLGDFGLACKASEGSSAVLAVGDKRYLPNEALEDNITDLRAVDLFSLGCTMYELSTGKCFQMSMEIMEMNRIRNCDIDDVVDALDPFIYELIRSLLHSDPSERRSAAELVELIEGHIYR